MALTLTLLLHFVIIATWPATAYLLLFFGFRGLLASQMHDTAKAIVTNLISLIDKYGFVLNGARAYYTNRRYSTPLVLCLLCYAICQNIHFYVTIIIPLTNILLPQHLYIRNMLANFGVFVCL